jgi:hypothetical protein
VQTAGFDFDHFYASQEIFGKLIENEEQSEDEDWRNDRRNKKRVNSAGARTDSVECLSNAITDEKEQKQRRKLFRIPPAALEVIDNNDSPKYLIHMDMLIVIHICFLFICCIRVPIDDCIKFHICVLCLQVLICWLCHVYLA